jgi:DMSO reductase family type II enzyme chaperone
MTTQFEKVHARSQLFQLLALGFAHPVAEFHAVLSNGSFALALSQAAHDGLGIASTLSEVPADFAEFEAAYIDLFQVGRHGKPRVHLNAGDYEQLAVDHSRPEFLLLYTTWYKHFGLGIRDDALANELPDHIVCQLELLTWLAHLEANTDDDHSRLGYQRAQRDFCQRHLAPFLELLVTAQQEQANNFYREISTFALEAVESLLLELEVDLDNRVGERETSSDNNIAAVNLWG